MNAARDARPSAEVELLADLPENVHLSATENGASSDLSDWIAALPEQQRLAIFYATSLISTIAASHSCWD